MPFLKQSFGWWCVAGQVADPTSFFYAVKQIGYTGVELLPRHLYDSARQAGLLIVTENAGPIERGWNRTAHHTELLHTLVQQLELARQYQIPNLIVFSGNRSGLSDEEGMTNTIAGLRKAAPLAEAAGVTLVLEVLNSKVDHLDYQCDHTTWAARVIDTVASPRLKILYDIYHMQIMEGDIIRTIQHNAACIGHVHTAGNPGRKDLDTDQELNYPAIIRALKTAGYTGFLGQEFIPKGEPLPALRAAFDLCNV